MKITRSGVRGDDNNTKLLNKPIKGKLAEKKTPLFSLLMISAAFILVLVYSTGELGVKDGAIITCVIAFFGVIVYIQTNQRIKESKKHKWKTFDNDK